ncbi:MAG: hypothetical protein M3O88_01790 [Actinomycetota bacterium]|nr:hypothetical protein [Actinomycetota bacterium]
MARRTSYAKRGGINIAYQILGEGPVDLVVSPRCGARRRLADTWEAGLDRIELEWAPRGRGGDVGIHAPRR